MDIAQIIELRYALPPASLEKLKEGLSEISPQRPSHIGNRTTADFHALGHRLGTLQGTAGEGSGPPVAPAVG